MTKATNLSTEANKVRVRRVKISDQTERTLLQLAEKYNCIYNGRLSISKLLSQIAEGHLKISKTEPTVVKYKSFSVPLIELEIEILSNLNGTLAEIAKRIADAQGNIYRARAIENIKNTNIKIELSIPKNSSLIQLIKSLYEIKIRDVIKFNDGRNLEILMEVIDPEQKRRYKRFKKSNSNVKIEDFFNSSVIDYQDERLVKNVICTSSFQIVIDNQPGTLNKLTHKIAEKHISICSIDIDVSPSEDKNLVSLSLGFIPTLDDISQKIESIHKFMRNLKTLDYVESVKQSSVEHQLNYKYH